MRGIGSDHISGQILLTVVLLSCSGYLIGTQATCSAPRVDRIYPNYGSRAGNSKITVTGCGFKSGSVLGTNTGTVIKLYNRQTYNCTLVDTTLFDHSLTCTTPPMSPRTYFVAVEMNGQTIRQYKSHYWYKTFRSDWNRTPYIYKITPSAAPPQSVLRMTGKMFTDAYGSNKEAGTNGNLAKILRFYATGKDCKLKDENDQEYGIALNSESSDYGYIDFKLTGTYVGNQNASFILDRTYGGSMGDTKAFHVSANKDIYMFQTYAEILSVSPSEGSLEGGTEITVKIKNLQNVNTATMEVGGVNCPIKERNEAAETLVCVVPKLGENATLSGGRGLIREYWSTKPAGYSKVEDILMYNETYDAYNTTYIENGYSSFPGKYNFVSRTRGYFVPPFTGEYSLMIHSDDQSALYMSEDGNPENKVKIANQPYWTSSYYTRQEQISNRTRLLANKKYYIEFVHTQGYGGTHMSIGAKYFSSDYFTNPMIYNARPEVQRYCFYSTTVKETQILKLGSFSPNQATVYEVQRIVITGTGKYRLQLYGVYTAALTTDANAAKIKTALQDLPFYDKTFFDFSVACPSQGTCEITFETDVGDIPMLGKWTSSGVSLAITEKTPGKASGKVVPLKHGSNYARPFLLSDGKDKAKSAIEDLFTSRCHKSLRLSGAYGTIHYDYDSVKPSITKNYVKTDVEAFCGRGSIRNPGSIYYVDSSKTGLKISKYNKLCLAYKDEKMDISTSDTNKKVQIRVIYRYKESGSTKSHSIYHTLPDTSKQTWGYTCIDLSNINLQAVKDDSNAQISQMIAYRSAEIQNLYIDEVNIAGSPTVTLNANNKLEDGNKDINTLRRSSEKNVDSITVDKTTDVDGKIVYTIVIKPINCDNGFSKFDVHSSNRPPSSTFSNTRTAANKPIEGTFSLTCNGKTLKDVSVDTSQNDFKAYIESLPGVGRVAIYRYGSCDNFCFRATFTNVPGDMQACTIDHSKVTGNEKNIFVKEENGHLLFDPIPGEFLRIYSSTPQVAANVNGIPSKCSADNGCGFEQKEGNTPTITGASMTAKRKKRATTSGSVTGPLYITGTGFDGTTMGNNIVTIGGVPCTVTQATSTKITCTPGSNTKGGEQKVVVMVKPNGYAKHPAAGNIMFKCLTTITNISPTSYGLGGGLLTITGTCFNSPTVTVNAADCVVRSHTSTSITCLVPPVTSALSQKEVKITQKSGATTETKTASQKFDYVLNQTPLITSINPETTSVEGGTTMTVQGSGFGVGAGTVTVGGTSCSSAVVTDTKVTCVLPALSPAQHALHIMIPVKGLAVKQSDKSVPNINYKFKVKQVYPEKGSLLGGTTLTVLGEKLSSSNITVNVGGHSCEVDHATLTNSKLICTIAETAKTHKVTNKGRNDLVYGKGLAWNPFVVTIVVGDKVEWCWSSDKHVTALQVKVEETDGPLGVVLKTGGFSSPGNPSGSGCFTYQFNQKGTYYYWSGSSTKFRGTVIVNDFKTHIELVEVKIGNIKALQARNAAAGAISDTSSCPGTNDPIPGVTDDPLPASPDTSKLYFTFAKAWTPTVSGLSPEHGSSLTTVNLTGIGFPATDSDKCRAEVTFGDKNKCTATSSSASFVQCMLDTTKEASHVGVKLGLQFRMKNRGYGLITGPKFFAITPSVTNISPCEGSVKGGTTLTIEGFSFPDNMVTVTIGGVSCTNVMVVSYDKVTCITQPSVEGDKAIQVKIGSNMVAEFDSDVCSKFSYNNSITPTCTSVSPDNKVNGTLQTYTVAMDNFDNNPKSENVKVMINQVAGQDVQASNGQISFKLKNAVIGQHPIQILVNNTGYALCTKSLIGEPVIDTSLISPTEGSIHGGTRLTFVGNGFSCATKVKIHSRKCIVDCSSVTLGQLVCVTPEYSSGDRTVTIGPEGFPSQTFKHTDTKTPEITSVMPLTGKSGDTITIGGLKFSATDSDNTVTINGKDCPVKSGSSSATEIKCTVGKEKAGTYDVRVHVKGKGFSDLANFTYDLVITSIAKNSGSCQGNQKVMVSGSGIDYSYGNVTICGKECTKVQMAVPSSSQFQCMTPPSDTCASKQDCDVVMTSGSVTKTLSNAFSYDPALTPEITCVNPKRGGTGGGTKVTITGSNFGVDKAKMKVTIAGVDCVVQTLSNTEITCETGSRNGTAKEHVVVNYDGNGIAKQPASEDCKFHYIDVWSSNFTWGGTIPPQEGDLVVIPPNQDILLDISTPKLSLLLIQGSLVFDEKDITLNAHYILVAGGKLQVGTEDKPFEHQATIMMHGHLKSKELPIYGSKVLAVREGILDLHGKPVITTWTRLESTANADDTQIVLKDEVDWKVGDKIVIATTGHKHSQKESEVRTITNISNDKKTLTLDKKLDYTHVGVSETVNGKLIEYRAEVGLLTRNVVFRGSVDLQWNDTIEACPAGFNAGEFATQTCFEGRFGEEIGTDQCGGHIIISPPETDKDLAIARISYVELTYVGQAFRLGRYPIHFHLNGKVNQSYVKGCSIHQSFNRAVNVHGTHHMSVSWTVIYNIMGGAFFLEDGIETHNVFQNNLAIFVIASSSLLNDDITPAAFWVTHPNNVYINNAAAGGTHFCFWYRMHEHPSGPSATKSVCGQKEIMGTFSNNTCHSQGWFGIWIFPKYEPVKGGSCSSSESVPAVFSDFFVWNCEKGAEAVVSGSLVFSNMILVNNEKAGIEGKLIGGNDPQPSYSGILVIGRTTKLPELPKKCTTAGIVLPYGFGLTVRDVYFLNFDNSCAAIAFTRVTGTCSSLCGAYIYHLQALVFVNSPNRVRYVWLWEGVLIDQDGTLTGTAGASLVTTSGSVPDMCTSVNQSTFITGIPASVCPSSITWIRFSFNEPSPKSLEYKDAIFINKYGNSSSPWAKKRISHKKGWIVNLVANIEYTLIFENAEQMTNFTYTGTYYQLPVDGYVIMRHAIDSAPDRLAISSSSLTPKAQLKAANLDPNNNDHGDWKYDPVKKQIVYLVSSKGSSKNLTDRPCRQFKCYRCYFEDCKPPANPNTVAPRDTRPRDGVLFWSENSDWVSIGATMPKEGDCPVIPKDKWMVVDVTNLPYFKCIKIFGTLEFEDKNETDSSETCRDFHLKTRGILIIGGRMIVGWEDRPFCGTFKLELVGNHTSLKNEPLTDPELKNAPTCGTKAICVFGGLDLHGTSVNRTWTTLDATAQDGTNVLKLAETVEWSKDDEIVVAATGYNADESEVFAITAVSADKKQITLNGTLKFQHIAHRETVNGKLVVMAAEVALLTRNVKIIGDLDIGTDAFGFRILVGVGSEFRGWARLHNIEFVYSGQEGYIDSTDPRYSITYLDTGDADDIKPSYVIACSFHHGFSPAIGMYGANNITVERNVIYRVVWFAIQTKSSDTSLIDNVVILVLWEGTFQGRKETANLNYHGAIKALSAIRLTLKGNRVVGAERMAFQVVGQTCGSTVNLYEGNQAHSCLIGLGILSKDSLNFPCQLYNGFSTWRNYDFGVYLVNVPSFIIQGGFHSENVINIFTLVMGPSAVAHIYANKFVEVRNLVVIGRTSAFSCSKTTRKETGNVKLSGQGRTFNNNKGNIIGIVFTSFSQSGNSSPEKPFVNIMAYPAIKGIMKLIGVSFAHFKVSTCNNGVIDTAIATNKNNDDGLHPMVLTNVRVSDVEENSKVHFHETNVGKVNPSDCVDMDCDGLKKALIKDETGDFLGQKGAAAIPKSEQRWNGDRRYGTGDYRIPKTMLTKADGSRIPINEAYDFTGIIRNNQAQYISAWNAYKVNNMDYYMMIVESMDKDTELRRLSPIAIRCNGYMDLINGPQDHGWCFGYTCQKRLSTFMILVSAGAECTMYLSSTNPTVTRFFLLNSTPDIKVGLNIYYPSPQRKDVYDDGNLVLPKNAEMKDGGLSYIPQETKDQFDLNMTSDTAGANYYNMDKQELSIMLQGGNPFLVRISETVVLSFAFPPKTLTEVYAPDQIVNNLATFLGVPPNKIRIVNIVRETGSRRKRATGNDDKLLVEIGDSPQTAANQTNTTESEKEELNRVATNMTNTVLSGKVHEALNMSKDDVKDVLISEPPAADGDKSEQIGFVKLAVANELRFIIKPDPGTENELFNPQPSIRMFDTKGEPLLKMGSNSNPWIVTASILSSTNANSELQGNTSVPFKEGWANFTDLKFSQYGDFVIEFNISYPSEGENFTLNSETLTVAKRQVDASIVGIPDKVAVSTGVEVTLTLTDKTTMVPIEDIAWRNHIWKVTVTVIQESQSNGTVSGSTPATFNANTGNATFNALSFSAPGNYYIRFTVTSTPAEYSFYLDRSFKVLSSKQASLVIQDTKFVKMKMKGDYNTIVKPNKPKFITWVSDILLNEYGDTLPENIQVFDGSIAITFNVGGSTSDVNSTIYSMCSDAEAGKSYDYGGTALSFSGYLDVGGLAFYGVSCGPSKTEPEEKEDEDKLKLILIIVGCGAALLLILAVAFFILWKCTIHPKAKTTDINSSNGGKYATRSLQDIESILFREKSFQSIGGKDKATQRPPAATNMLYPQLDNGHRPSSISPVYNTYNSQNKGGHRSTTMSPVGEPPADYPL